MLLFAAFISIFALDVFEEPHGLLPTIAGLLIHLLPTFLIIGLVLIARKNDILPAVSYTLLGFIYIVWAWGKFPFINYLIIAGPLMLAGILHGLSWTRRKK